MLKLLKTPILSAPLGPDFPSVSPNFPLSRINKVMKTRLFDVPRLCLAKQRIKFTISCRCTPISTGDERECERQGNFGYIVPPVTSAFLTTRNKFSFMYGRVEIRCRVPIGDWLYARKRCHFESNFGECNERRLIRSDSQKSYSSRS